MLLGTPRRPTTEELDAFSRAIHGPDGPPPVKEILAHYREVVAGRST